MKSIIEKFYDAFTALDGNAMAACYHPDIAFEDPAFGNLKGEKAKNMWRMLCESQQGKDFQISYSNVSCSDTAGSAHWEAKYVFSQTGRSVHNKIDAEFELKDGLIIKHVDTFNLQKWAKQALGFKGAILGGTAFFKKKLNAQTIAMLAKWESRQ